MIEPNAGPSAPVRRNAAANSASIWYSHTPGRTVRIASRCAATVTSIARRSRASSAGTLAGAEAVRRPGARRAPRGPDAAPRSARMNAAPRVSESLSA